MAKVNCFAYFFPWKTPLLGFRSLFNIALSHIAVSVWQSSAHAAMQGVDCHREILSDSSVSARALSVLAGAFFSPLSVSLFPGLSPLCIATPLYPTSPSIVCSSPHSRKITTALGVNIGSPAIFAVCKLVSDTWSCKPAKCHLRLSYFNFTPCQSRDVF